MPTAMLRLKVIKLFKKKKVHAKLTGGGEKPKILPVPKEVKDKRTTKMQTKNSYKSQQVWYKDMRKG